MRSHWSKSTTNSFENKMFSFIFYIHVSRCKQIPNQNSKAQCITFLRRPSEWVTVFSNRWESMEIPMELSCNSSSRTTILIVVEHIHHRCLHFQTTIPNAHTTAFIRFPLYIWECHQPIHFFYHSCILPSILPHSHTFPFSQCFASLSLAALSFSSTAEEKQQQQHCTHQCRMWQWNRRHRQRQTHTHTHITP